MTSELTEPIEATGVVLASATASPVRSLTAEPSTSEVPGSDVTADADRTNSFEAPTFLRAWRGYDRHQVDTFAHQSLALIQALRRRAQRAESRLAALEKQLVAYRRHGHDVLADPAAQVEMATSRRLQDPDEGLVS